MKPSEGNTESVESPSGDNEESTGLPGLRSWRGVYVFVFGCFVLWVVLLLALAVLYS